MPIYFCREKNEYWWIEKNDVWRSEKNSYHSVSLQWFSVSGTRIENSILYDFPNELMSDGGVLTVKIDKWKSLLHLSPL